MHQSLTVLVLKHHNFPYQKCNGQDVIAAYGLQGIHVSAVAAADGTLQMPPLLYIPLPTSPSHCSQVPHTPPKALEGSLRTQGSCAARSLHCKKWEGRNESWWRKTVSNSGQGSHPCAGWSYATRPGVKDAVQSSHGNYNLYRLFCSSLENFKWLTSFGTAVLTYLGTWFPNTL